MRGWMAMAAMAWLAACRVQGPLPDQDPTHCSPKLDTEQCDTDDAGLQRRMRCDTTGRWVPIATCPANQQCQVGFDQEGLDRAACVTPGTTGPGTLPGTVTPTGSSDASSGSDGSASSDAGSSDGGGTDATGTVPKCGDGVCNGSETTASCAQDCQIPTGTVTNAACWTSHCPSQAQTCLTIPTCTSVFINVVACIQTCGGGQGCVTSCAGKSSADARAYSLAVCGYSWCIGGTGACGDGQCGTGESSTNCPQDCKAVKTGSCVGHCGTQSTDCYCDPSCTKQGDCCSDFAGVCGS
jgi:hypothetical protein